MNNCYDYIIKMNQYLDGELSVNEISDLLRHIEQCDDCRRRFETLKTVAFETRHLRAEPPHDLHENIMRAISQERPVRRRRGLSRFSSLVACGVVLMLLAGVVKPYLRNVYLFGGFGADSTESVKVNNAGVMTAGGTSAAQSAPEAYAADYKAKSEETVEEVFEDSAAESPAESESAEADDKEFAVADETVPESGVAEPNAFLAPQLRVAGQVGFYIVTTGTGNFEGLFPVESVIKDSELGETYVFIPNTETDRIEAEQRLADAGFVVHDSVENLPPVDSEAEYGLIVIFESR